MRLCHHDIVCVFLLPHCTGAHINTTHTQTFAAHVSPHECSHFIKSHFYKPFLCAFFYCMHFFLPFFFFSSSSIYTCQFGHSPFALRVGYCYHVSSFRRKILVKWQPSNRTGKRFFNSNNNRTTMIFILSICASGAIHSHTLFS